MEGVRPSIDKVGYFDVCQISEGGHGSKGPVKSWLTSAQILDTQHSMYGGNLLAGNQAFVFTEAYVEE